MLQDTKDIMKEKRKHRVRHTFINTKLHLWELWCSTLKPSACFLSMSRKRRKTIWTRGRSILGRSRPGKKNGNALKWERNLWCPKTIWCKLRDGTKTAANFLKFQSPVFYQPIGTQCCDWYVLSEVFSRDGWSVGCFWQTAQTHSSHLQRPSYSVPSRLHSVVRASKID